MTAQAREAERYLHDMHREKVQLDSRETDFQNQKAKLRKENNETAARIAAINHEIAELRESIANEEPSNVDGLTMAKKVWIGLILGKGSLAYKSPITSRRFDKSLQRTCFNQIRNDKFHS